LHYVLLFPRGEDGWHPWIPFRDIQIDTVINMNQDNANYDENNENSSESENDNLHVTKHKYVTLMQFYSYRLQVQTKKELGLHLADRLF